MPDESRSGLARALGWVRRRYHAELLALAPDTDERGMPLVWDFAHPVNRSPAWRLLRPWMLVPTLLGVASLVARQVVLHGELTVLAFGYDVLGTGLYCTLMARAMRWGTRARTERASLRLFRWYRWRGSSELEAIIAAARDRARELEGEHALRLAEAASSLPPTEAR